MYLTAHGGPSAIGGLVRFEGEATRPETAKTEVFYALYPYRVPIRVLAKLDPPREFAQIKARLRFIPKHSHWGAVLQGQPIKPIPASDFNKLKEVVMETTPVAKPGGRSS